MKTSDFFFDLPEELIAQYPPEERGQSRLLVLDRVTGRLKDSFIRDMDRHIEPGSLLVFNNSKVRKARLYGTSETGSRVEFLLLSTHDQRSWKCMVNKAKKQKVAKRYIFPGDLGAVITAEEGEFRFLEFERPVDDIYLDVHGHIPLPPYIRRPDEETDASRYQTIFADRTGSAAAPTAGLHFTRELLERLEAKGIETARVTLHVGPGTFSPVRTENVEDHKMHSEFCEIDEHAAGLINAAKVQRRPVIAVGTTSLRTLESMSGNSGTVRSGSRDTDLFVYPGYKFRIVDGLFTNFHTPDSSLILLVSAFAGAGCIKAAYSHAIAQRYRFFSYGDAMLIRPGGQSKQD